MKATVTLVAFLVVLAVNRAFGVQVETYPAGNRNVALVESESPFSFEFHAQETYIGEGDVHRGSIAIRDFDGWDSKLSFILTPRVKIGILRLGVVTEHYSFSYGSHAPIPEMLDYTAFVLGLDTEFSDSFLIRLEAQPGFYGTDYDDFGRDTFNVPFIIGGTYIFNSSFQVVFGIGFDALRKYPALPGGGVRWKFAPQWTLNAVAPTPRLEYEINSNFLLYGGADVILNSYRVDKQFGTLRGDPAFNHAALSYDELRVGGGFDWKLSSATRLSVEGGYIPFRTYYFHRLDARYREDGGAPYMMLAFHAAF
jgi:hypothetical protein